MSERLICDSNSGSCTPSEQSGQPMWYQREFENLGKPAATKQASVVDTAASYSGLLERVEHVRERSVADQLQNGQRQRGPQDRGHHPQGQQPAPEARVQHRQQRQDVQPPQDNPHADRRQGDRGQAHVPPERQQIIDAWKQRQAAQDQQRVDNRQQGRREQGDQRYRNDGDIRRHPDSDRQRADGDNRRRPDNDDRRRPDGTQVVRRPHIESPNDPRQQLDPRLLDQRQQQEQQRLAELQRRRQQDHPGNRQTDILEQQIRRQLETSNGRHVDQNLLRQLEQARRQQQYRDNNRGDQGLNWSEIQRQRQFLDAQRAYDQRQINPQLLQQMLRNAQRGGGYDDYRVPYRPGGSDYYDPRIDQSFPYDRRYAYDPRYDQGYDDRYRIDPRYDRYRVDPRYDDYARNDWDPRGWDPYGRDRFDPYGRDPYGRDRYDPHRGRNDIGRQLAASIIPMILGQVFNQIGNNHRGYDRYGGGYDRWGGGHDRWGHGHRPCPRGGYQSFGRGGSNPVGMLMQVFRGF